MRKRIIISAIWGGLTGYLISKVIISDPILGCAVFIVSTVWYCMGVYNGS